MHISTSNGLITFLVFLVGNFFYVWLAKQLNIIDKPNERSSHTTNTVRGLGIMFSLYFALGTWYFECFNTLLTLGLLLASVVGFADDRITLSASLRFVAYLISVVLVAFSIQGFSDLPLAIMGISAVLILGVINMYNFMDGVNGISLIYAFVFFLSVVFLYRFSPSYSSDTALVYVILLIVISCFWFNIRVRALAFLGDAGSIFLGLLISYFVCNLIIVSGSISYLILVSVYAVDSVGTIILRLLKKQNIFDAHRLHLYQMLANEYKWGHLKVASFYAILQAVINGLFITHFSESDIYFTVILILLTIVYLILRVKVFHDFSFTKITQD